MAWLFAGRAARSETEGLGRKRFDSDSFGFSDWISWCIWDSADGQLERSSRHRDRGDPPPGLIRTSRRAKGPGGQGQGVSVAGGLSVGFSG
jgi:hypothetical protein